METVNSVLTKKEYGSISFHVKEVMDSKNITRGKLSSLTGVRFEVADRLYKGNVERMDMDVLARVCFALNCEVGDIIKYNK